jgi:hypothetical protein
MLDERLSAYARAGLPVLISVAPPSGEQFADRWASAIQSLAEHARGRVAGYQIEAASPPPSANEYAFFLKLASVRIKAIDAQTLVAQATGRSPDASWLAAVAVEGTAPYVDLAPFAADASRGAAPIRQQLLTSAPSAAQLQLGVPLGDTPAEGVKRLLVTALTQLGEPAMVGSTFAATSEVMAPALSAIAQLKDLFAAQLLVIEDARVSLAIEAGGRNVTAEVPHRLFLDSASGGMYLALWNDDSAGERLSVSLVDQSGRRPVVRNPLRRDVVAVQGFSWDELTKVSRLSASVSATPLVLDFDYGRTGGLISRTDVSATGTLSVDEIVARNQQAQTAQALSFRTFIASLRLELHFRPAPGQVFDVVTENRFYFAPDAVEWEERSFSVNSTKWGPDRPPLPLLQAEKVLTLPLDLRLTVDYRYRLERIETVGDRPCYVVAFEPSQSGVSRYRGLVWIDTERFLRVKVQTIQTHLEGPIVSNEELTFYAPVQGAGRQVWLPSRMSTKQILLIAGRNLLLEKEQWFTEFRIDAPEFDSERQAARAGAQVMFRDTDAGIRYLVKKGDERVVSNVLTTSSKALALGTTIDPTFDFPLPIVGLNYLNFDFRGSKNQLAVLFGGVFALGNLQAPKLGKTPFNGSIDFFGIAVPGSDLRFDSAGERTAERVMTIPMSTGLNLGYQFSPFQKFSLGYVLRYDAYFRATETAEDFQVPSSTATHGGSIGYEFSRHGYRLGGSASAFKRTSWDEWGPATEPVSPQSTYQRYSVNTAKDFLLGPFQSAHAGVAWYGGANLDRFSMYQFGLFDELRMHGVPSSGVRFPELVLVRGSYSFNLFGLYRLDLFVDHARGRDPNNRTVWQPITGTGAAITLKAPWNTIFTADVGKSFMPDLYRGTGSVVMQFLILKPLSRR